MIFFTQFNIDNNSKLKNIDNNSKPSISLLSDPIFHSWEKCFYYVVNVEPIIHKNSTFSVKPTLGSLVPTLTSIRLNLPIGC